MSFRKPLAFEYNCTIKSVGNAILSENTLLTVEHNYIDEVFSTAIFAMIRPAGGIEIKDNQITECKKEGIAVKASSIIGSSISSIDIRNNKIELNSNVIYPTFQVDDRLGIRVNCNTTRSPIILNNTVEIQHTQNQASPTTLPFIYGIHILNNSLTAQKGKSQTIVEGNSVKYLGDQALKNNVRLYAMENLTSGVAMTGNDASGSGLTQNTHIGYQCTDVPTSGICGNISDVIGSGFEINFNCDGSKFRGNSILEHKLGLNLQPAAYIGDQVAAGNSWPKFTSSPNFEALNQSSVTGNKFFDNHNLVSSDKIPEPVFPTSGWFDNDASITDYDLYSNCAFLVDPGGAGEQSRLSIVKELGMTGDATIASTLPVYGFEFAYRAYEELFRNWDQYSWNPDYSAFYEQKTEEGWGKLTHATYILHDRVSVLPEGRSTEQRLFEIQQGISVNNSAYIVEKMGEFTQMRSSYLESFKPIATSILNELSSLNYTTQPESLIAEVLKKHCQLLISDGRDTDAILRLKEIAQLCREDYGPAVLMARQLVPDAQGLNCIQERSVLSKQVQDFILYPNPASNVVTLQFSGTAECLPQTYQVFNSQGKLMLVNQQLRGVLTQLNVDKLPSGVYLIKAVSTCGIQQSRLVVTH